MQEAGAGACASAGAVVVPMAALSVDEQRTRADMWFRRAGELLDEVSTLRAQVTSATAVAATLRVEATTAQSEVAALATKCELLQKQLDERHDEQRHAALADIEGERSERRRMASELGIVQQARERAETELAAEKQSRQFAEAERARQEQRAETLRGQVSNLEQLLERAQHEARRLRSEEAPSSNRAAAAPLPSTSPPAPPSAPAPPPKVARAVVAVDASEDTESGRAATERALSQLVRGIVGGELEELLVKLRDSAIEKAEAACGARVAVLEAAVGELLGSMDAETHRLLLKWRAQVETTQRENALLREQQRIAHVRALDNKKLIQSLQMEQHKQQQQQQQQPRDLLVPQPQSRQPPPPPIAWVPPPLIAWPYPNPPQAQPVAYNASWR